jgi:lipopolysaccharide export system permease protein
MLYENSTRSELARNFSPTLVVLGTIVITMILIRTLGQASIGRVNPTEVSYIIGFNLIGQLSTIISLSLYIAVVATVYRMYMDNEMIIWQMSGKTFYDLAKQLFVFSWPILVIIFVLTVIAWPWANQQTDDMKSRFNNRSDLARVAPGVFQESANGNRVYFVDKNPSGNKSQNVFISSTDHNKQSMTSSQLGFLNRVEGDDYLMLEDGQRIEETLGDHDIKIINFKLYGTKVQSNQVLEKDVNTRAIPINELIMQPSLTNRAELFWRMSIFIAAFNYVLMALALTSPNARLGRGGNFSIAILFFVFYNNMINVGQNWISEGLIGWVTYSCLLHGIVGLSAIGILYVRRQ